MTIENVQKLLDRITPRGGGRQVEAIAGALAIWSLAAREEAKGNRLAFLDAEDNIVREITGFNPLPGEEHAP